MPPSECSVASPRRHGKVGVTNWIILLSLAAAVTPLAAPRAAPAGTTTQGRPGLRLSVGVLPFFSACAPATESETTADLDGYLTKGRKPNGPAGPADHLAELLTRSGGAVGIPIRDDTDASGSLKVQVVLLTCDHRKDAASPGGWEAFVELGVQVLDTTSGTELRSGFYRGSAPAQGPLKTGARAALFAHGIGAYLETPLGRALDQALGRVLNGDPTGITRDGLLPLLSRLTWEGRVTRREGDRFWINAGAANGLRIGDTFTPYAEEAIGPEQPQDKESAPTTILAPLQKALAGQVRVLELQETQALLTATDDIRVDPQQVAVVQQGVVADFRSLVSLAGVPKSFSVALHRKLNQFESESRGLWPLDSISVNGSGKREKDINAVFVDLRFWDERTRPRSAVGSWSGYVGEQDGAVLALACFDLAKPRLIAVNKPDANDRVRVSVNGAPLPPEFVKALEAHLDGFAVNSGQVWSVGSMLVSGTGMLTPEGIKVTLNFEDTRDRQTVRLGSWTGTVEAGDRAPVLAAECFAAVRESALEKVRVANARPSSSVTIPTAQTGAAGSVAQQLNNRRQRLKLWFGLAPKQKPPAGDTSFKPGDPLTFLVRASEKCWVLAYNLDARGDLNPLHYDEEKKEYHVMEVGPDKPWEFSTTVVGPMEDPNAVLGAEYLLAVAWTDEPPAKDLLQRKVASLTELTSTMKRVALENNRRALAQMPPAAGAIQVATRSFIPTPTAVPIDPQPLRADVVKRLQQVADTFASGENAGYATAWMLFRSAPAGAPGAAK